MLDHLKQSHPKVVEELVPNLLPLGSVVKVLHNLLAGAGLHPRPAGHFEKRWGTGPRSPRIRTH